MSTPWPSLDWQAPWFAPWRGIGEPALAALAGGASVPDAMNAVAPAGVPRFVSPDALPPDQAYESFVHDSRSVPSRDNLHDCFNAIVWCLYPDTKRQLNRWQAAAIARDGIAGRRGPLRDAITLFDENGAVFSAPPVLLDALRSRDWRALFITHRQAWQQARLWLFGHALVEKLAAPRKDITAHVLCAQQGLADIAQTDAWLLSTLDETLLSAKPFSPLPVLGVPGWWPVQDEAFYDDAKVFRPARPANFSPYDGSHPQPSQGSIKTTTPANLRNGAA
ncbi:DUF3025 domain-containing protein [Xylophilus rhododendri]|uniref:DUF3025 domain-containing protein n=1 Tax=Xylophilus rhododendri TaxID=2697032 RepID=UPI002DD8CC5F|nr:DUF3025 domain-containing protein [Xylophilus rhododendri]